MKKNWKSPILEVLDLKETLAGPGLTIPDAVQTDPDEHVHHES
ncbi:paeninodin family lasso peptide [Metabacillus arenae]|uniref:Paeninodin family lasso peptide n=1 Tax=Metabacillus arenae TaxID=2771434 RepID=A0A926RZ96_9BACI|nr:paeninodin family lasso peptide [Metabacillus arenae]MBD1378844.1 paeninodin family lasso peptide [Metabacillus arenae]